MSLTPPPHDGRTPLGKLCSRKRLTRPSFLLSPHPKGNTRSTEQGVHSGCFSHRALLSCFLDGGGGGDTHPSSGHRGPGPGEDGPDSTERPRLVPSQRDIQNANPTCSQYKWVENGQEDKYRPNHVGINPRLNTGDCALSAPGQSLRDKKTHSE